MLDERADVMYHRAQSRINTGMENEESRVKDGLGSSIRDLFSRACQYCPAKRRTLESATRAPVAKWFKMDFWALFHVFGRGMPLVAMGRRGSFQRGLS